MKRNYGVHYFGSLVSKKLGWCQIHAHSLILSLKFEKSTIIYKPQSLKISSKPLHFLGFWVACSLWKLGVRFWGLHVALEAEGLILGSYLRALECEELILGIGVRIPVA